MQNLNLLLFSDVICTQINYKYFNYLITLNFSYNFLFTTLSLNIDLFALVIQFTGLIVGFLSYLVLDTRYFFKNIKYLTVFCLFDVVVILFTTTNNIIFFFLFYELLLLPAFLLVYNVSQARRATQASLYFVI